MVRGIGRRGLAKIVEILFSVLLVTLGLATYAARPQSSDSAASAKLHYQNAVAAQSKGDWQTAKSELLQAENLAPQNALVHYDLALAYSHTGQVKSAQTEVTKALQLGLPPEQKKAAENLKQQLAGQADTPGGSATKQKSSASVAEILDWLTDKVASESRYISSGSKGGTTLNYDESSTITEVNGCNFTVVNRMDRVGANDNPQYLIKTRVDLSQARNDIEAKKKNQPDGFTPQFLWYVDIHAQSHFPQVLTIEGKTDNQTAPAAEIAFPDEAIAGRVAKALGDAVGKCGGKKVQELY